MSFIAINTAFANVTMLRPRSLNNFAFRTKMFAWDFLKEFLELKFTSFAFLKISRFGMSSYKETQK